MRRGSRLRQARAWLVLAAVAAGVAGCGEAGFIEAIPRRAPSTIEPQGPAAEAIAQLWWWLFGLAAAVLLAVVVFLGVALFRPAPRRRAGGLVGADDRFIAWWGIAIPAVILTALLGMNVYYGGLTYQPSGGYDAAALEVEVVGHQFWWEVRYHLEDETIVDANELHIPAGEAVALRLESRDVIHSFWVPELHGKMDMVPGHRNRFWIQADEPGTYRGVCAEYCGLQHAQMHFLVVAHPPEEFAAWVDTRRAHPPEGALAGQAAEGRDVFVQMGCASCHTVAGLSPPSAVAPDLTNLANRLTIAAGMQPNTPERLRGWILDPHESKPGVRMPPTTLSPTQLEALLAFFSDVAPDDGEGERR